MDTGGPPLAEEAPLPSTPPSARLRPRRAPVIGDGATAFATAPPTRRAPQRLLDRALARPSSSALVGLLVAVVLFGLLAPDLLTSGGLAGVLDVAAPLGIGAVAVALLLVAGEFDFSSGPSPPPARCSRRC